MDSRTAAHVLTQIGALLELNGSPRFKARAFQRAARSILALGADDLTPLLKSGELARTPNVGPATLSILKELIEEGESNYLQRLTESIPRGLIQMVRVPGLGLAKVSSFTASWESKTSTSSKQAARDGRLAKLRGFGAKTAERILAGISSPANPSGAHSIIAASRRRLILSRQ